MKTIFMQAILLCLLWMNPCYAQSIPFSSGAAWLSANQNTDGSWGTQTDLTFVYSAEAVDALKLAGTGSANYAAGINWINLQAVTSTDELSRQIYSLYSSGTGSSALISTLLSYRNPDGGWSYKNTPASDALDNARALQALKVANYSDTTLIGQSLGYLTNNQNTDGGWGFYPSTGSGQVPADSSNVYMTAIVSATIQQFSQTTSIASAINRATSFLITHQNADGGFGTLAGSGQGPSTVYETALAYEALANVITDATVLGKAVNYLTTIQSPDGSWGQDPYSTALALKALYLAETRPVTPLPPAPTTGTMNGTVIDASTNQPLSGVSVVLASNAAIAALTNSTGAFSLADVSQGTQQITFSSNGYATYTATVPVTAGSIMNLGSVPLSIVPSTGIIQGTVTDASNGSPLSGVTINVTGTTTSTAATSADGTFKITNIAPGSISISASKSGYTMASASSMVTAGQTLIFSPSLSATPPPAMTGGLSGKVIDSATSLPLPGATISVAGAKNYTASTDNSGNFAIPSMNIGSYSVSVSATGYGVRTYSVTVTANVTTDFGSIALTLNPTTGTVSGTVTDASTNAPISGVAIAISGASTMTAVTIADGSFKLEGITPGAVTLSASKNGYDTVSGAGAVVAGGTLIFNVSLASTPSATTGGVKGVCVNASTGQPVTGAIVTCTPSPTGPVSTATSDATGAFVISSAPAGNYAISVTAPGYISQTSTLTIVANVISNIGKVQLTPAPTSTTITGKVTDAVSGAALPNVDVSVVGTSIAAKTDSTGAYTLTNVISLAVVVKASATGYDSHSYNVSTTSYGAYAVDFALVKSQTSALRITSLVTDKQEYSANENVMITANIENTGNAAISTIIQSQITDNEGNVVALTTPANPNTTGEPFWVITIAPSSSVTVTMPWNTAQFAPGDHEVNLNATTPTIHGPFYIPGTILAQQGLPISIQPFVGIANSAMKCDPTFVYTGATAPLTVSLTMANQSNIPADLTIQYDVKSPSGVVLQSGTVSAALSLDMITTTIPLTLLNYTFVENGEYPVHAIAYHGGVTINEVQTVFVVLSNIRMEPSRTVTPDVLFPGGTGKVTTTIRLSGQGEDSTNPYPAPSSITVPPGYKAELFATGLSSPVSIRVNGSDEFYVAESTKDRIVKVSPTGSVSIFANSGPGTPLDFAPGYRTKIDVDKNGNLYVGCVGYYDNPYNPYGDLLDTLYKITSDGVISIVARQYVSPNRFYDISSVAVSPDGALYVFIGDTWSPHDILKINLTTKTSTMFATSVYYPYDLLFDKAGNLYVCMSATSTEKTKIYRFALDGTKTVFNDTIVAPVAMAWGPDGLLYVLDAATKAVYTIDPSTKTLTPFATGFTAPYDLDFDSQGNLYVLEYQTGQIIKILTTGAVFNEVRLIDTIPTKDVEFVLSSVTRTPYSITTAGEDAVVEWRFNSVTAGKNRTISYDLNLFNLLSGEDRLVDRALELIYKDLNNQEITVDLPPLSVRVLSSVIDTALSIDKPQYQAQSDVGINALIESTQSTVWYGTVDVLIEDAAGNLISHASTTAVNDMAPLVLPGWAYRVPASVTASQAMRDVTAKATVDFASIMQTLGIAGKTIDKNSIRVLEYDAMGNIVSESQAQATFTSDSLATIAWLLNGTTARGTTRHFFIYFDMTDHNPKAFSLNTKLPRPASLIAYSDDIGRIFIMESNGDGTFGTARLVSDITSANDNIRGVVLEDFNNDGFVDILTGSGTNGDIYYLQNTADGSNTFNSGVKIGTINAAGYIMGMAAADFDNDGNKDFVVSGNNNILYLFRGKGDGTFTQTVLASPPGASNLRGKATGDVDKDGKPDLVVSSYGNGGVYLYKGNGNGTFASPIQIGANGSDPYGLIVGDFDENGVIDIIQSADINGNAYLFKGLGNGMFGLQVPVPSLNPNDYTAFTTGDFNNDGHLDVIAVTFDNHTLEFYPGYGDATFGAKSTIGATASYCLGISSSPALPAVLPAVGAPEAVPSHAFNFTWNTGSTLSGNYQVHAVWSDGTRTVAENRVSFAILPDPNTAAKIVSDKASYNPNETTTLTSTVTSKSVNTIMESLTARIRIQNPVDGSQLYAETKPIPTLMLGESFTFKSYWNTGTLPPGAYPVTLEVKDAVGALITTGTTTVTITNVIKTSAALKGSINLDKQSILTGETVNVSYIVTNSGNVDLQNVTLSVLTVHMVAQTVYDTLPDQASLAIGASYADTGQINTTNYSAMDYLVILRANIAGTEETLAGTYFRIEGAPSAPSLASPAMNADVETFTPSLSVNNASDPNDDKLTYEFEVYGDSGLTSLVTGSSGQGTVWTVPFDLTENQAYFWRCRAYDGKLYGDWMQAASFRVNTINDPPTAPTVSSPAVNGVVDTLLPVLGVTNASDPDSSSLTYNFDVALDPNFTQIVVSKTGVFEGVGTTSWQVTTSLTDNTTYFWRCQADDWLITGPWMTAASFFVNTANDAPTAPVIIAPLKDSTVAAFATDIVITNSTDPDSPVLTYLFEVDTVPTFDSPGIKRSVVIPSGLGTTTWQVNGLQDNTQYYVRAKANDSQTDGPWSDKSAFFVNTVNDPPTAPVLANPSDGAGVTVFTPTLSIHDATDPDRDVLTYDFEVYNDAALASLVTGTTGVVETPLITSWLVPVSLSENRTYYWRARASDGKLASEWMPAASFMVNTANDAPGAPTLSSPVDGSGVATLNPTLSVTNAVDPDSTNLTYSFEVYSGTTLVASVSNVPAGSSGITSITLSTALTDNTVYQWRVRANDGDQYGPWMAMAAFTVHLQQTGISATIDFDPNTLNKTSTGNWVVVYIELPVGYNVADINVSSVRLNGAIPAEIWPYAVGDHDKDGIPDLMVKFKRSDVINLLPDGDQVTVHVTGRVGATTFDGVDIIRVMK